MKKTSRTAALGIAFAASILILTAEEGEASPCSQIWQKSLTEATALISAEAIRASLPPVMLGHAPVYEHMSVGPWHIVWAEPDDGEPAALFIKLDGKTPRLAEVWGGVVREDERRSIENWALTLAPQFPPRLAQCFAWYVTVGRYKRSPTWPNPFNRDASR